MTTAVQIARQHDAPIDVIPEFTEWNPGQWSGLTRNEVHAKHTDDYDTWVADPAIRSPIGGESLYDVAARSISVFAHIVESHGKESIAIVGHNTLNRVLLAHFLDIPIRHARDLITQQPGCVNRIRWDNTGTWRVISVNESLGNCGDAIPPSDRYAIDLPAAAFLDRITSVVRQLTMIWPSGRNPCPENDGVHWTLPPFERPVSIGRIEAYFLYNIASILAPQMTVEVGTGFGYSTLWLAGGAVVGRMDPVIYSIDNRSEGGLGHEGLRFARHAARQVGVGNTIRFVHGESPSVLSLLPIQHVDLAFIDGSHHDDHPRRDFVGLASLMSEVGVVIWHDVDERYSVPDAYAQALREGWFGKVFPTSCRIGVTYRSRHVESLINKAYTAARSLCLLENKVIHD